MAYSPEEAQAAVAALVANPIPATARQTRISGGAFNSWDIRFIPGQAGHHYEDVRIDDQEAEPSNPGIREVTASTYGQTIPVSLGRRRLPGNVLQSSQMIPRLVGGRDYEITYQVPMYADPPDDEPYSVDVNPSPDRERPDPNNPPGKCKEDPCNPLPDDEEPSGTSYSYIFSPVLTSSGSFNCSGTDCGVYTSQAEAKAAAEVAKAETGGASNFDVCKCEDGETLPNPVDSTWPGWS